MQQIIEETRSRRRRSYGRENSFTPPTIVHLKSNEKFSTADDRGGEQLRKVGGGGKGKGRWCPFVKLLMSTAPIKRAK